MRILLNHLFEKSPQEAGHIGLHVFLV
jgi:hypothetical protein